MNVLHRTSLVAALLLVSAPIARAQIPADPSGHWAGSIQIPGREVIFELDLVKNGDGRLVGTMNSPAEHIKGLPLRAVAVEGRSISFDARRDQPLRGTLSADGTSVSGDATVGGYVLPFSMSRTGDAEIIEPARGAPIGKELEGTWNGTLSAGEKSVRVVLRMANQPDGTSTGRLVNLDEGEQEIPVAITQQASRVIVASRFGDGSFSGALNSEGTELTGSWTQGPLVMPATFKRSAK